MDGAAPGGADPLFGDAGPAGTHDPAMGPDMPPGDPMGEPGPMDGGPGGTEMPPMDDMGEMHTHMDDAGDMAMGAHGPGPMDGGPGGADPVTTNGSRN